MAKQQEQHTAVASPMDDVIKIIARIIPGGVVRKIYREINDELGEEAMLAAHELIAAGNPRIAGVGRISVEQAKRVNSARRRLA